MKYIYKQTNNEINYTMFYASKTKAIESAISSIKASTQETVEIEVSKGKWYTDIISKNTDHKGFSVEKVILH